MTALIVELFITPNPYLSVIILLVPAATFVLAAFAWMEAIKR